MTQIYNTFVTLLFRYRTPFPGDPEARARLVPAPLPPTQAGRSPGPPLRPALAENVLRTWMDDSGPTPTLVAVSSWLAIRPALGRRA